MNRAGEMEIVSKTCSECKQTKGSGDFPLSGVDRLKPYCKECDNLRRRSCFDVRPAKLTLLGDKIKDIEERLMMGYSLRETARIFNINYGTLGNWVRKGYIKKA